MESDVRSEPGSQNPLQGGKHEHSRDREHDGRGDDRLSPVVRDSRLKQKRSETKTARGINAVHLFDQQVVSSF